MSKEVKNDTNANLVKSFVTDFSSPTQRIKNSGVSEEHQNYDGMQLLCLTLKNAETIMNLFPIFLYHKSSNNNEYLHLENCDLLFLNFFVNTWKDFSLEKIRKILCHGNSF